MAEHVAADSHIRTTPSQADAADVNAELHRILSSRCFVQAGRASEFLRFVVEQTLAGNGDRLKGYTIAVEVFGRPADFDAQSDPLVRVEAGRLRRRLVEYYAREGAVNPLRIELPLGSYAPEFRRTVPEKAPSAQSPSARKRWRKIRAVLVATTSLVALGIIGVRELREITDSTVAERQVETDAVGPLGMPSGPRLLVLPFENLSADPSLDYFTSGMTEEVMLRLSQFDLFVIAPQTSWYYGNSGVPPESAGAEVDAGYILVGSVRNIPERVRISARLLRAKTGEQLWTAAYDETLSVTTLLSIQERIAQQVVTTIAVPYGPIFEHELRRAARTPAEHLDTYDCLLKYYYYRRTLDPTLHGAALECFQRAVEREAGFADAWAGLGLLYLDEHGFGYSPQRETTDALARAQEATRTAMDIDGQNYLANLAMARVRFFSGDQAAFERSTARVLELDPYNADALALLGTLYALLGETARARPLIDQAALLSPHPPGTYHLANAVIELRAGRAQHALEAALRVDAPNWFIAPMLVTVTASLAGRDDVARRSSERLLELYPTFPERAREELGKWQIDPAFLETLLEGLRAAGLEIV